MSTVFKLMFEGFSRVVVKGDRMNWFPPVPPLPTIDTLLRPAIPLKLLIPAIVESTLNGIPEILLAEVRI